MRLGKFAQSPDERKRYTIAYDDWLSANETISSAVYTVSPSGLVVDDDTVDIDGLGVAFYVSGGTAGTDYTVHVLMTSSAGQIKEDTVLYVVRNQ